MHTVLTVAAVELEGLLVAVDVELDARPGAGDGGNGSIAPVVGAELLAVDDVAGVVAGAVGAAVTLDLWVAEALAHGFGRAPEIVDRALLVVDDRAGWDQNTIGTDALAGVWQVDGVVESERGVWVLEAIKIPVSLFAIRRSSMLTEKAKNSRESSS